MIQTCPCCGTQVVHRDGCELDGILIPKSKRNCDRCGKEYIFQRKTSKFCSANCRVLSNQKSKLAEVEKLV
jgi:endogenous inhibitor of DNA gyrase (YacG/DUF329 family)